MAERKRKPVKVTAAVVNGIKSGQVPKQTLALRRGSSKPKPRTAKRGTTGLILTDEGPGKPAVVGRQRPGSRLYTMRTNKGGTITTTVEGKVPKRGVVGKGVSVKSTAPSTKAKNTGGLAKKPSTPAKASPSAGMGKSKYLPPGATAYTVAKLSKQARTSGRAAKRKAR